MSQSHPARSKRPSEWLVAAVVLGAYALVALVGVLWLAGVISWSGGVR